MTTLKKQYVELAALAQLYLLQEYTLQQRIFADPQVFEEFKQHVLMQKKASQPSIINPKPTLESRIPPPPFKPTPTPVQQPPPQPLAKAPDPLPPTPKPAPKSVETKIEERTQIQPKEASSFFELEPLEKSQPIDFADFRGLFAAKFPLQPILDAIPSDVEARRINRSWEELCTAPEVIILSFHETAKHRAFLGNLCQAVETLNIKAVCSSAAKFEQEDSWSNILTSKNLRLIIANDHSIHTLPKLMKHYKEVPKKGLQFLDKVPLLLLSDLSFYFKEPSLKSSLWKALKELLPPAL